MRCLDANMQGFTIPELLTSIAVASVLAVLAVPVVASGDAEYVGLVRLVGIAIAIEAGLIALVTLRFKISIHISAYAALAATLFWLIVRSSIMDLLSNSFPTLLLLASIGALPFIAWARVRAGAHTPIECVVGLLFGFGVTISLLIGLDSVL